MEFDRNTLIQIINNVIDSSVDYGFRQDDYFEQLHHKYVKELADFLGCESMGGKGYITYLKEVENN